MLEVRGPSLVFEDKLPVALGKGTIVDLETTGRQSSRNNIVCFGSLFGSRLEIRARIRRTTWGKFYADLRRLLRHLPKPLHAYNAKFDSAFLKRYLGYKGRMVDLFEPWRSRAQAAKDKYPSLDELVRGPWDVVPPHRAPVRDPTLPPVVLREEEEAWLRRSRSFRKEAWESKGLAQEITGKDVPKLWRAYLRGDDDALLRIAEHNRQDLVKELCLAAFLTSPIVE